MYEEYKLLPKGMLKKDFNIRHGRYGAGIRKRKPRWSEATLAKREATKEKREVRARRKALYEEYKLLPKGLLKKDFNIAHGRYGAGICKRNPRYTREEIDICGKTQPNVITTRLILN